MSRMRFVAAIIVAAAAVGLWAAPGAVELAQACWAIQPGNARPSPFWSVLPMVASPLLGLAGGLLLAWVRPVRWAAGIVLAGAGLSIFVLNSFHSQRTVMATVLAVMPELATPYLQYLAASVTMQVGVLIALLWPPALPTARDRRGRPA